MPVPEGVARRAKTAVVEGHDPAEALSCIGVLIDAADDYDDGEASLSALALCDQLAARNLPNSLLPQLDYFRANAWATRRELRNRDQRAAWTWDQLELANELLHLRKAASHPDYGALPVLRRCQIMTNLANALDFAGRFVDAVDIWNEALALEPRFAMALGNKGNGLRHYALALHDPGHRVLFLREASTSLHAAMAEGAIFECDAEYAKLMRAGFGRHRDMIDAMLARCDSGNRINLYGEHHLGASSEEKAYRQWRLRKRLFLNPLNDLWSYPIAACDVLTLPNLVTPASVFPIPSIVGLYNQMKQEYVSARWNLYKGLQASEPHYSDKEVYIYDTLDYPIYGLSIEQVKTAFRAAYSLFDKIAFFINDYFGFGAKHSSVSFRTIWHAKQGKSQSLRPDLVQLENWPLRGLFWIAKDLFEPMFSEITDPDAREISTIRNHLEHRHLHIHEGALPQSALFPPTSTTDEQIMMLIERREFEAKTLRLMLMAKAALIHLSLAVGCEETKRAQQLDKGSTTLSVPLHLWDDNWKC